MLEDVPQLDALIVPVGGGGLISGCAIAAKAIKPAIEIFGAQSELYPAMFDAMNGLAPPSTPASATIAEGIAVKRPGQLTTAICKDLVQDIFVVGEDAIEHALIMILEIEKTVIEGAAASGFAALLAQAGPLQGPPGRYRDVGRQYRHAAFVQCDPARADAGGPHHPSGAADRGPPGPAGRHCPHHRRRRRQCPGSFPQPHDGRAFPPNPPPWSWWWRPATPNMHRKSATGWRPTAFVRPDSGLTFLPGILTFPARSVSL